jgi:hypothetical protein
VLRSPSRRSIRTYFRGASARESLPSSRWRGPSMAWPCSMTTKRASPQRARAHQSDATPISPRSSRKRSRSRMSSRSSDPKQSDRGDTLCESMALARAAAAGLLRVHDRRRRCMDCEPAGRVLEADEPGRQVGQGSVGRRAPDLEGEDPADPRGVWLQRGRLHGRRGHTAPRDPDPGVRRGRHDAIPACLAGRSGVFKLPGQYAVALSCTEEM